MKLQPPVCDQTDAFAALVKERGSQNATARKDPDKGDPTAKKRRAAVASWNNEAYRIKRHIASLYVFLSNIRRPYLDMSARGHRTAERGDDGAQPHLPEIDGRFGKWQQVVSLTDAERDEIDFQVKLFVKQCLERVQELERGEKLRQEAVARALGGSASFSPFALLQGAAVQRQRRTSDELAAHHAGVTQYLSEQLARASSMQAMLQERRMHLRWQRFEKLADRGHMEPTGTGTGPGAAEKAVRGSVGALGMGESRGVDVSEQLSSEQLHVFEEEASQVLQSLQQDMQAIQRAERQLNDISELQSRIVQHLQEQNEHSMALLDDAAIHGQQVTSGNQQLQTAKKRNRQANRFLSLFFVISGVTLLFAHWINR